MNAIVIQHVKVGDLPEEWRTRIAANEDVRVTVRIEEEAMWSDREDDRALVQVAGRMSQQALARVWDNPEDSAYDALWAESRRAAVPNGDWT